MQVVRAETESDKLEQDIEPRGILVRKGNGFSAAYLAGFDAKLLGLDTGSHRVNVKTIRPDGSVIRSFDADIIIEESTDSVDGEEVPSEMAVILPGDVQFDDFARLRISKQD